MNNIYTDGSYLDNNPDWHVSGSPWKASQIAKIITKNEIKFSSLSEIGCGAGEILKQLSNKYFPDAQYSGYEISPQAFELSKQRESNNVKFYHEDIFSTKDSYADIVMAIDVFEHVDDYIGFIREIKSKGKYKIFNIPLDIHALNLFLPSRLRRVRDHIGHIHYFTKESALATLEASGHEVIDWFYTRTAFDLPRPTFKAEIVHLFRRVIDPINEDLSVKLLGGASIMVITR